jgi:hypothetical protein
MQVTLLVDGLKKTSAIWDILQERLNQVSLDWKPLEIGMYDASTLLKGLPTTSNPSGTDIVNLHALPPFQLQPDKFLWAIHCDRLLWSTTLGSDMVQ